MRRVSGRADGGLLGQENAHGDDRIHVLGMKQAARPAPQAGRQAVATVSTPPVEAAPGTEGTMRCSPQAALGQDNTSLWAPRRFRNQGT